MERTNADTIEKTASLITHYRPLRLKAVVAATSVKGRVPEAKQSEGSAIGPAHDGFLDIPCSD